MALTTYFSLSLSLSPPPSPLSALHTTYHRSGEYRYARGTTGVLKTSVRKFVITSETVSRVESMET